jgi:hypothetical protein
MTGRLRKLNDAGIEAFRDWINSGATGPVPLALLDNPETSDAVSLPIVLGTGLFDDRYQFGVYLNTLLRDFDPTAIASDRYLWTSLALFWFDRICPTRADGSRDLKEEYYYILSADYRHYYRHLVRSPWQLVRLHGQNARFLLISPRENAHPLSIHGEILEQFGGRQQVLSSRPIVAAANRMYLDPKTGRPRTGVAGSGRGSARRFGLVLRQLDLTYDAECMPDDALIDLLPDEFEKWRSAAAGRASASRAQQADQTAATATAP